MSYNLSSRLDKYTQTSEFKENEFHFGMYLALASLAGTIIYTFSDTTIWITSLNMAVASFLIILMGVYKKKDKRAFLLFYTHGAQTKEIIKNVFIGCTFILLGIFLNYVLDNMSNGINHTITIKTIYLSGMKFILRFMQLVGLTTGITFIVKPLALIIVKQAMHHRKE